MISDKNPYSRESTSHGRRSSILKRQDSCFTSEGADGNTECPRTPRRVSFASTATVRYLQISSGDESCVSSNNGSDTSSTSSGSSQSTDHDSVFAEPIPQLQDSCNGAVDQPSVFVEAVCNSTKDIEMEPSNCAAASLVSDEDKTIFFTSMNMSLSDISETSLGQGDDDEPNCISVRQPEEQNHTILYTETDQDGCCMELTSNLSQLSESLLQESNAHLFNNARLTSEPKNKPGLKRRPSFADGGKSESGDDQAFVRMYTNSAKENVPDCTIIFGNKGGEEMEFTQIIPVPGRPYLDETLSSSIAFKPKPQRLDDLFQLVKKKELNYVTPCSREENLSQGVADMEFTGDISQVVTRTALSDITTHKVLPSINQSVPPALVNPALPPVLVNRALPPALVNQVVESVVIQKVPAIVHQELPKIFRQAVPPTLSQAQPPVLANHAVASIVTQTLPPIVDQELPKIVSKAVPLIVSQAPIINQALPQFVTHTLLPVVDQAVPQTASKTVSPVRNTVPPIVNQAIVSQTVPPIVNQVLPKLVNRALPPVIDQAVPRFASQSVSPFSDQTVSPVVSQELSPIVDHTLSPGFNQILANIASQAESPIVNQSMLPILVNHAGIPEEDSFLSDLKSVCKTEQMLSESVNLQDLYEILGISRLERAHIKSVPVQKLPAATGREKLVAKTISMSRLCCLKQHLNDIEAAINRSEQECTEKLIQFSDKPPEILAAFQAKENNVSDLRTKAQAVVNSCRILAQAVWKRYKVDYHMKYSEAIERECQSLDVQISEVVSSTEKVLDLTAVVDKCLQKVDLILEQKQGLAKQQEQFDETERELQKLRLQCKQMDDRVNACTEENKEGATSLTSIDVSQEGIEERLSLMNSFTEWTILRKDNGKIHFGFLFNTLILEVDLTDTSNSCQKISRVNLISRLAAGSKSWAKLAHNLTVLNISCRRLQDSYTDYHQMQQLLADVSAIVCDFRQFSMELKLADLKHCLTIDDNRLKITVSNRKTRQKITLSTSVEPNYHPHYPLVWTATTLIGSISPQDVKSAVDQIVHGPNYMTRVLSQAEKLLATMKS